jgi:hypothetical protein
MRIYSRFTEEEKKSIGTRRREKVLLFSVPPCLRGEIQD